MCRLLQVEHIKLHTGKAGQALVWRALDDKELKSESLELLPKVNRDQLNHFFAGWWRKNRSAFSNSMSICCVAAMAAKDEQE